MTDTADIAAGNAHKSSGSSTAPSYSSAQSTSKVTTSNTKVFNKRSSHKKRSQRPSLLRRQSSLLLTHIQSSLPATPTAWALACLSLSSAALQYELRLQKSLSSPPDVFCNLMSNSRIKRIYDKLSNEGGIWNRNVVPSLFVGTRGVMSSFAAYALKGGEKYDDGAAIVKSTRVREVMTMGADGARLVLDWEVPIKIINSNAGNFNADGSQHQVQVADLTNDKVDNISRPIVLLVHGMNNDSSFGYIRSMMKTATSRGWVAVCMNLRGQDYLGQVKNTTPRGYNAGFTGDLRGVIQQLEKRLAKKSSNNSYLGGPIYLVGYSLGANIVTKYLGEESLHGTLPKCIGGGAALGNPLHIASNTVPFPWNMILAMGVKRSLLQNFSVYNQHHERGFRNAIKKAMTSRTIGQLDDACAPYILRNEPYPPFAPRVGYQDGNEYWHDSSSHRYVGHVSVPLLKVAAKDDFLVFGQFARKLNHCLENPNVVVVKTRCGGHLGWQESPPPRKDANGNDVASSWFGGGIGSWSDVAVADFIEALLQIKHEDECREKEGSVREGALPSIVSKL